MLELPRVSHVLDVIDWGYKDIPKFILKHTAKYGTGFHRLVERKTTGKRARVTKQFKTRFDALQEWFKERKYKVKEAEIRLTWYEPEGMVYKPTPVRGYQGTCDAILIDDKGNLILIDYKTGRVSKRHFLQCAAYQMAYEQQTGNKISNIIIVKPTKQGLVEEYILDKPVEHYEKVFLRLLDKYYDSKRI